MESFKMVVSLAIQIDSILRLFDSPFPRTISTFKTEGRQVSVNTIDEILKLFEESRFVDCRINAYPLLSKKPNFVMADLDLIKFKTELMLIKALDQTVTNIRNDLSETKPMVLFTGGGYHVYQPIDMPVLEEESMFSRFDFPSTEFIRYAAQRWTNGKNDPCNKPSVKSCLLRVPGSINSKNLTEVELFQDWNGKRPKANKLLLDFYIKLAAKIIAGIKRPATAATTDELYFNPSSRHFARNYDHYGHTSRHTLNPTAHEGIAWIDSILSNGGRSDYRKTLVDLVIAPYLVNVKQCAYDEAYNKIIGWLDKCGRKRRLDFNARQKVKYALSRSKQNGIRSMRLDTMKTSYFDLYQMVVTE
jgi:hypothetical protein